MTVFKPAIHGLYAIADTSVVPAADLTATVEQAIDGGAAVVQYRDKGGDTPRRLAQARSLARLCRERGVPFIVNDDVALGAESGADGVHLGRDDQSPAAARRTLGRGAIIGVSCYNELSMAIDAQQQGADYVAFGAFFVSPTKPHAVRADLPLLHRAKARLSVPMVAIGGITPPNAPELIAAGADAVAVIHGVFGQPDAAAAARRYAQLFHATRGTAR
jgi:thiamine-phosphate pyrophosphorylase